MKLKQFNMYRSDRERERGREKKNYIYGTSTCDLKNNLTNSATSVYFHKKQYKHKSINIQENI